MQTHDDRDFRREWLNDLTEKAKRMTDAKDDDRDFRREWLNDLTEKAKRMTDAKESEITAGKDGEEPLAEWKHKGVGVIHLPPDEHGILRISIGGGEDTPVDLKYCVFRGNRGHCIDLMRRALSAMESGPGH